MPISASQHTGRHARPAAACGVAIIAYERRDGRWDVFVFEPVGVCPPEWEARRVDKDHVEVAEVDTPEQLEEVVRLVNARLGPGYEPVVAHEGTEPECKVRIHRLHKAGCTGYRIEHVGTVARLWVRRRDLPVLGAPA